MRVIALRWPHFLLGLLWLIHAPLLCAQEMESAAWEQLLQIQRASERLNYSGVFIYQMGDMARSSRITHLVDSSGSHEKLEMLDGKLREFIRHNNEVHGYRPEVQTITVQQRHGGSRFPALSAALNPAELSSYYSIKRLPVERVAGLECQGLLLTAKDQWRHSYRFWADRQSGLLLKSEVLNAQGQAIEQIAFTEVHVGETIDKQKIKPSFPDTALWTLVKYPVAETRLLGQGWSLQALTPGFKVVHELRRDMPDQPQSGQIVLSDGLSAVSIFIQPYQEGKADGARKGRQGAINLFARRVGDYWITVLGEVPAETVKTLALSLEYKAAQ